MEAFMNSYFTRTTFFISAMTAIALSMSACNKKNDDTNNGISNGSVSTDGITVKSSSALSGYALNLSVGNFKVQFTQNSYNPNTYNPYQTTQAPYNQAQSVSFDLSVNNEMRPQTVALNTNSDWGYISNTNGFNNNGYNNGYNTGYNSGYNGGFQSNQNIAGYQQTIGGVTTQTRRAVKRSASASL
jgi:hypothetical protein